MSAYAFAPRAGTSCSLCNRYSFSLNALYTPSQVRLIHEFTGPGTTVTYLYAKVHEFERELAHFDEPGQGQAHPSSVILSAAKDLRPAPREILRCAQDDSSP